LSESLSSKYKIQGVSYSEGKDSTRNLEIIRPIETLPMNGSNHFEKNDKFNKMSMIHEEDYQVEHPTLSNIQKRVHRNTMKTTNDHINEYYVYQAQGKARTSQQSFKVKTVKFLDFIYV